MARFARWHVSAEWYLITCRAVEDALGRAGGRDPGGRGEGLAMGKLLPLIIVLVIAGGTLYVAFIR